MAKEEESLVIDQEISPEVMNYRREYSSAEKVLKNDSNPERALETVDKFITEVLENSETEKSNYFLRVSLPKYVLFVMNRSDLEESQIVLLNDFLIKVINLCIQLIPLDIRELYNILVRIFTHNMPIYKVEDTKSVRDLNSLKESFETYLQRYEIQGDYAHLAKTEEPVTAFYFVNINYFAAKNGFAKIYDRIVECESVQLSLLKCMLKPIITCHELLSKAFMETYVTPLKTAVFEKLLNSHSGPLVREEKSFYREIAAAIQILLRRVMPPEQISPMLDQFNLDLGGKGFESNNLQRRLGGLKLITRMVKRAMIIKDETNKFSSFILLSKVLITGNNNNNKEDEKKKVKPIDPNFVLNWLNKTDFLSKLFNENSHPAEIKQGILIPKFLAIHQQLKNEHIDMLWRLSLGKHESVQSTIFEALIDLTEDLPLPQIQHLYESISSLKEVDNESLKLLAQFTPLAIERDGSNKNWYGMKFLYELCLDGSKAPPQIAESALQYLVQLLKLNICVPCRVYYIGLCANNLKDHISVPQSLEIIKKTLDCYPKRKKRGKDSAKYVIETLNPKFQFVDILLEDLALYKEQAKTIPVEQLEAGEKLGNITHMEHIKIRLGFLEYILSNSSLKLTGDQAETLWDSLVTNMLVQEERSMCFKWLEEARSESKGEFVPFEENVIERLFVSKMTKMDATQLNLAGYIVFEQYFLSLNEKAGKIKSIERFVTQGYSDNYTTSSDLLGLNNMWRFALDSHDEEISRRAMKCLNMLYQNVPNDGLKPNLERIREGYIAKCMELLSASLDPVSEERISRCISLLKLLVEEFEMYGAKSARSVTGEITLYIKADKGSNFPLVIKQTETLSSLRQIISEKYGKSPQQLRITINNQEIKDSDRTLEEIKIPDGQSILVRAKQVDPKKEMTKEEKFEENIEELSLRSLLLEVLQLQLHGFGLMSGMVTRLRQGKQKTKTTIEQKDAYHPANTLSAQNFQFFYGLLDKGTNIASSVWNLLNLLPINKFLKSFESIDQLEANLESHLSEQAIYKLAYSLKIISEIIKKQQNSQNNQWCNKFLELNGLKLLLQTFMTCELGDSIGHATAFALILRIINFFITYDSSKLEGVELPQLISRAVAVSKFFAKSDEDNSENSGIIVKQSLELLISCLKFNKNLDQHLFDITRESEWLHALLLESPVTKVRQEMSFGIAKLCRIMNDDQITVFFFQSSLAYLSTIESYPKTSDHFFLLLEKLNDLNQSQEDIERIQELLLKLITQVKKHPVLEASDAPEEQDKGLIGFLNFIRSIVKKDRKLKVCCLSEGLIDEVYTNCLFSIPTADDHGPDAPPKCKTRESRYSAYRLLVEVAKDAPENFSHLYNLETKHFATLNPGDNWQIVPGSREKASHGYVGLQNLGATCYMNSLLQQLYMVPSFRQALLDVEDKSLDISDSVLYQMQYLFSYLQESLKRSYNTTPFCQSYKDYDGNPINPAQQQDANEFFNMLFDKLEGYFAGTPKDGILKELFGGTLANQFISKECEHSSENTEQFYTIGVEIKNKKDILSSFELFIEGEMLMGESKYMCEICDKRVDALKRCCIKTLPPILVIQLKRFEFDYNNMRNQKLNDRCAFPLELDMEPYTVEGIAKKEAESDIRTSMALRASDYVIHPPEYYQYELRGIVVHTGTAECGHYYSFIKERAPLEGKTTHWFEFNDTSVVPWNINRLANECFGGTEQYKQVNRQTGQTTLVDRPIANNAYILVYERKSATLHLPKQIKIDIEENVEKENIEKENNNEKQEGKSETIIIEEREEQLESHDNANWKLTKPSKKKKSKSKSKKQKSKKSKTDLTYENIKAAVPDDIMTKIWQENQQFINERQVYDNNYFTYVWKLVNLHTPPGDVAKGEEITPQIMQNVEISTRFLIEVYSHSRDISMFPMWIKYLKTFYQDNVPASLWFIGLLTRKRNVIRTILMECPIEKTRKEIVDLIDTVFRTLVKPEREFYKVQYQEFEDKKDAKLSVNDITSWLIVFLESLITLMHDVRSPRFVSSQYFQVFQVFAEISPIERKFLIYRKFHSLLIDFIMGTGVFSEKKNNNNNDADNTKLQFMKGPTMGRRMGPPNITHATRTLVSLIKSMNFGDKKESLPPTHYEDQEELFQVAGDDDFLSKNLLLKIVKDCNDENVVNDLIVHLCWADAEKSQMMMKILAEIASELQMPSQVRNLFTYFTCLQDIVDSHQLERIDSSIRILLQIIDESLQNKDLCKNIGMYIANRQKQSQLVKHWIQKNHGLVQRSFSAAGFSLAK